MERIEMMEIPNTRAEFEYRFHLLRDMMEKDMFRVNQGISLEGLSKIRYLPNGRIDFLSVDEQARCMVNTTLKMRNMKLPESLEEN
ncbi:AVAST type 1 anti-phage system protein Avs1c [Acinetobacter sp. SA01]|uniref:AVAST type 1 anti-phage system protein Avs1c n=1 Tax=Acinetobacter sp. SA01 TaxID=1862567 RepID=UPI00140CC3FF|nr:AVAST type 1 anti-phage system protein Avs1c [Acinetobacter sp. SA01]